jgi:hypothetical protein
VQYRAASIRDCRFHVHQSTHRLVAALVALHAAELVGLLVAAAMSADLARSNPGRGMGLAVQSGIVVVAIAVAKLSISITT